MKATAGVYRGAVTNAPTADEVALVGDEELGGDDTGAVANPASLLSPAHRDALREILGDDVRFDEPMRRHTTLKIGGPADAFAEPASPHEVAALARWCAARGVTITVVGGGSNLIVRDGGVEGVVIRLGRGFNDIKVEGNRVRAGTAAPDLRVAKAALEAGIAGLAFLRGIPGAIGGALRMNGGAYGRETKDVLLEARGVDRQGRVRVFGNADMGFAYRHCGVPEDVIFTQALFSGTPGNPQTIQAEMQAITEARESTQPVRSRTGGSTFKNPPGQKAWQLIDQAGCRGLKLGDAQVSEMHCNFLINLGNASAADIENLGELVRRRVRENSGVELEWEIRRIGVAQS